MAQNVHGLPVLAQHSQKHLDKKPGDALSIHFWTEPDMEALGASKGCRLKIGETHIQSSAAPGKSKQTAGLRLEGGSY